MREPADHGAVPEMPSGFGVIDGRGRLTLPKAVRQALRLQPGSSVAFIAIDDHLLVIPQDSHLAQLMDRAAAALARLGLTSDDLLADLPAAGEEAMRRAYGDELVDDLKEVHARTRTVRDE
jgi:AbrB family looped-hinge helix DNA binding protein